MRLATRTHGMLDYAAGVLYMAAPWLLGFARGGPETWIFVVLGAASIALALVTDYELGVLRRVDVPVHLFLDAGGGVLLAVSPWLFGFDTEVWIPHVVAGLLDIGVAAVTNTIPGYERRGARQA
ncbi:MAG TPA: SPW repeat protein [Longimicrobiaceae bacterium]|nr:SPW repeat protein [Longimicrobiaceae bacterium]